MLSLAFREVHKSKWSAYPQIKTQQIIPTWVLNAWMIQKLRNGACCLKLAINKNNTTNWQVKLQIVWWIIQWILLRNVGWKVSEPLSKLDDNKFSLNDGLISVYISKLTMTCVKRTGSSGVDYQFQSRAIINTVLYKLKEKFTHCPPFWVAHVSDWKSFGA